ncbi:MAG: NAD(P)-dependent oxidoreductase [Caldilineaceae bacterium]
MKSGEENKRNKPIVLVTGSSGLIGTALIKQMAADYQIVGFDNVGFPFPPPQAENVPIDLTDSASLTRGMARVRYAYGEHLAAVVHLAAYYDFSGEPSPLYEELTVRGTERMLHALRDFDVERFIFTSTMLAHQPTQPGHPFDENWPLEGKWDYPQSKIETEQLIHQKRNGIPTALLRIAGVYTDRCDSIPIAQQMRRIYENSLTSHLYPGNLDHGQSFVHLDDTVAAIVRTVEKRRELPAEIALLIGEPDVYSYGQLQQALGELIHGDPDWKTETIPKEMAKIGAWVQGKAPGVEEPFIKPWMIDLADDHYEIDIRRARQLLGWNPPHRLIHTLPKMVQALRADPKGWYEAHDLEPPADLLQDSESDTQPESEQFHELA